MPVSLGIIHKELVSGNSLPGMYEVSFNLSKYNSQSSILLFTFTELWLMVNCKSPWCIKTQGAFGTYDTRYAKLVVSFVDAAEATYFKLSSNIRLSSKYSEFVYGVNYGSHHV